MPPNNYYHPATVRAQALGLHLAGISFDKIKEMTGMSKTAVTSLKKKALARGLNPAESSRIEPHHVEDAPRSGRPKRITDEIEQRIMENAASKEKSNIALANEIQISETSVRRILQQGKSE